MYQTGESAGGSWEYQRKADIKAPSSFHPGEFTFELKKTPEGNQAWLVLWLPELQGRWGMWDALQAGLVPYRAPSPNVLPQKNLQAGVKPFTPSRSAAKC